MTNVVGSCQKLKRFFLSFINILLLSYLLFFLETLFKFHRIQLDFLCQRISLIFLLYSLKLISKNFYFRKDSKDAVIEQLSIELKEKDLLVYKLNTNLQGHLSEISKLSAEVSNYKTEVSNLKESLEMQRNKNNVNSIIISLYTITHNQYDGRKYFCCPHL